MDLKASQRAAVIIPEKRTGPLQMKIRELFQVGEPLPLLRLQKP